MGFKLGTRVRRMRASDARLRPRSPAREDLTAPPRVGIVVATFNTRRLIGQLILSLYRLLGRQEFAQIVVVDNASTDGSAALLTALHEAGLLHLIRNDQQRYHGPALTQGISWLAERQSVVAERVRLAYVWTLDSDVIVLRPDTVRAAVEVLSTTDSAAVGQTIDDPAFSTQLRHNPAMLHPSSLLFDPAQIWRPPIPPFLEQGAPAESLQVAADAHGLRLTQFPFLDDGYALHLGRGTLRAIAESGDVSNRYYRWAVDHRLPHFAGRADRAELYEMFCSLFNAEVGGLARVADLIEACRKPAVSDAVLL